MEDISRNLILDNLKSSKRIRGKCRSQKNDIQQNRERKIWGRMGTDCVRYQHSCQNTYPVTSSRRPLPSLALASVVEQIPISLQHALELLNPMPRISRQSLLRQSFLQLSISLSISIRKKERIENRKW